MLPTSFPESNFVYTKPKDWTDEQCMDLPVWKGPVPIDDAGATAPTIISCWKLSKEDLEEINRTGCVWLLITGTGMPPVSVAAENPFTQTPQ
jgi:hypothetical protein